MIPRFVTETLDRAQQALSLVQDNVQRFVKVLEENPLLDGKALSGVVLATAAATEIKHSMGRTPKGYLITKSDVAGDVYLTESDETNISLYNTGAEMTVDLWVF